MEFGRTANPTLSEKTFSSFGEDVARENQMTLQGTVNKTAILLALLVFSASWTWWLFSMKSPLVVPLLIGGAIGGLVLCLVTCFKKAWAGFTSPLYAICEGLVLGAISALFERKYPGIVPQAVGLTMSVTAALLLAYKTGIVKATENFKLGVIAATMGIGLLYLVSLVLHLFGIQVPYIHDAGPIGIIFSLFVVTIAALNLVLDFDFIETGVAAGAPKYMEWYGAFGLLVTLVWLYIEILRLLSKLRDRR
jgi:uncharacterized YccA/Bax inhibitor family protein